MQTERILAGAPPRLAAVRQLQIAIEVAKTHCNESLVELLSKPFPSHICMELEWNLKYETIAAILTPAQLRCIPNIVWSQPMQTFINTKAKAGRLTLEKAQAALELIIAEKSALLDRLKRQNLFRAHALEGIHSLPDADENIVFHISFDPSTGKDKAWTPINFGDACLIDTEKLLFESLQPLLSSFPLVEAFSVSSMPICFDL